MFLRQRRIIIKYFTNSQFGYCRIVWMCYSRTVKRRINNIDERSLRLVHDDCISTVEELLHQDNSVTVHESNIQALAVEVKILNCAKNNGRDFPVERPMLISIKIPIQIL